MVEDEHCAAIGKGSAKTDLEIRCQRRMGSTLAIVGIFAAASASSATIAESAISYANNVQSGDIPMADLDALTIGMEVQNIGADYFVTAMILGVLLQ